ncbi:HAMP domain-containing protein, partial [Bifidobacterium sp. UMB1230]|nr:HAMP domain-containing protein [Bifidobacterium sp. UMB1230]
SMDQQNHVLKSIRNWMIGLSIIAIIVFVGLSYLIVNSVVQPIKKMSQFSHDINEDPTNKRRVPDLHRNDELGELAISFNEML